MGFFFSSLRNESDFECSSAAGGGGGLKPILSQPVMGNPDMVLCCPNISLGLGSLKRLVFLNDNWVLAS